MRVVKVRLLSFSVFICYHSSCNSRFHSLLLLTMMSLLKFAVTNSQLSAANAIAMEVALADTATGKAHKKCLSWVWVE